MNLSKTRRGRLALIDSWQMKQKALDSLIFRFCASVLLAFAFAWLLACLPSKNGANEASFLWAIC